MNPLKFIHNLFIDEPKIHTRMFFQSDTIEEFLVYENRYIQATDLLLKEIELLVNGNGDFNKVEDKQKIQILLKIFREIEYNLVFINSVIAEDKKVSENLVSCISSEVALKEKHSEQVIAELNVALIAQSKILEEINKFQSFLSDVQERKRQIDKKVKELGTIFCYQIIFLN
jgi:hypothetical protein